MLTLLRMAHCHCIALLRIWSPVTVLHEPNMLIDVLWSLKHDERWLAEQMWESEKKHSVIRAIVRTDQHIWPSIFASFTQHTDWGNVAYLKRCKT